MNSIRTHLVAMVLLLIGGLLWGLHSVDLIKPFDLEGSFKYIKCVYMLVGLSALYLLCKRNVYLPFLGDTVFPCSLLKEDIKPDNADTTMTIKIKPNSKVVYWASDTNLTNVKLGPTEAYNNYSNAGVTTSDANGNAVLSVRKPSRYTVRYNKLLPKHIHYRICDGRGMLGQVETVQLQNQ